MVWRLFLCGALSFVARAQKWFPDPRGEGGQRVERFALGSARLRDFLVRFLLLFPATLGGIQSYEDFPLNTYLWLQLGLLFRLPTIALSAQYEASAPSNLPPLDRLT